MGQNQPRLLLRRILPLMAVVALAAPSAAAGGSPDPAPSGARLAPDPAPTASAPAASRPRTIEQAHAFVPRSTDVPTTAAPAARAGAAVEPRAPARPRHRERTHARSRVDPIVVRDVAPLAVDVPAGLGSVAASIRDDSAPTRAALALLAAALTAASGAGLALAWSRQQGVAE